MSSGKSSDWTASYFCRTLLFFSEDQDAGGSFRPFLVFFITNMLR